MHRYVLIAVLAVAFSGPALAEDSPPSDSFPSCEASVSVGYQFLLSRDHGDFYRNHDDLTEGLVSDKVHLAMTHPTGTRWFDSFRLDAAMASRLDGDRSFQMDLHRLGRYEASIRFSQRDDFFLDPWYNYGLFRRDVSRGDLRADFRWTGVKHFIFSCGYTHIQDKGTTGLSTSAWGDLFRLPQNRRMFSDEGRAGLTYSRGPLTATFCQSWTCVENVSRGIPETVSDVGLNPLLTTLDQYGLSGRTRTTMPASSLLVNYRKGSFEAELTCTYRNASLDTNTQDLRTYHFLDFASRNQFLLKAQGNTDLPEHTLSARISASPTSWMDVEYEFHLQNEKADTTQNLTNTLRLGIDLLQPLETTTLYRDVLRYRSHQYAHTVSATVFPMRALDLRMAYTRQDGTLQQSFFRGTSAEDPSVDYSLDRVEVGGKYRPRPGTLVKASYRHERQEDPLFRVIPASKNEFQFGLSQTVGDKLSLDASYRDARSSRDSSGLNQTVKLLDMTGLYALREWVSVGAGFTRLDLNYAIGQIFILNQVSQERTMVYDTVQDGYYIFARFQSKGRLSGSMSLNRFVDRGASQPESRWTPSADLQFRLTRTLSATVAARYLGFRDDFLPSRNYSFNQIVLGLRWALH